jgi:hypothetical protein
MKFSQLPSSREWMENVVSLPLIWPLLLPPNPVRPN